jgi:hypothetical protein
MLPLLLGELVKRAKGVWSRPQQSWQASEPAAAELGAAEREAVSGKQYDKLGLKENVWNAYKAGAAACVCKNLGTLARVVAFMPAGAAEPPWEFWARIFEWFGHSPDGKPWHVTWFASPASREFPQPGQDLGPEHVNGGYTQICSTDGIFIYRAEEVTRVLIHEMVHAACMDEKDASWTIPLREAMVETWAELILIALKSHGSAPRAKRLWVKQSHWIADTNWKARQQHNEEDHTDYAWRYLSGRREMYASLGIELPKPRPTETKSLRFTHPALDA